MMEESEAAPAWRTSLQSIDLRGQTRGLWGAEG
jgi:hypothetical protein